jgi:TP901 family phage tail tape measure protein
MVNFAELEIRVSTTNVKKATADLDKLEKASTDVEKGSKKASTGLKKTETAAQRMANAVKKAVTDTKKMVVENAKIGISATKAAIGIKKTQTAAERMSAAAQRLIDRNRKLSDSQTKVKTTSEVAAKGLKNVGDVADKTDTALAKTLTNVKRLVLGFGALRVARAVVGTLTTIEDGLVKIAKTADLTDGQVRELSDRFKVLGSSVSTPLAALFEIGEAAGQFGIRDVEDITTFTEAIVKLGDAAPSLSGDLGATALEIAKISGLTGVATRDTGHLTSAIVKLGNDLKTTEAAIVRGGLEVAKAGAAFGITGSDAVALAAAFSEVGIEAEVARSTLTRVFSLVDKAIATSSPKLLQFAELTNRTAEEFTELFESDPSKAFAEIVVGLEGVNKAGGSSTLTLEALGITSLRAVPGLNALAKDSKRLGDTLEKSKQEFIDGSAAQDEFARGADTLSKSFKTLVNSTAILTETVGNEGGLGAALRAFVDQGGEVVRVLAGTATESEKADKFTATLAVSLAFIAKTAAVYATIKLGSFFIDLAKGGKEAGEGLKSLSGFIKTNPYLALAIGVTAVITAYQVLAGDANSLTEEQKLLKQANEDLKGSFDSLADAEAAQALGERSGDAEQQLTGVNAQIAQLQKDQKDLIKNSRTKGGPTIDFDALQILTKIPAEEIRTKTSERVISIIQDALTEVGRNEFPVDLSGIEATSQTKSGPGISKEFKEQLALRTSFQQAITEALKAADDEGLLELGEEFSFEGLEKGFTQNLDKLQLGATIFQKIKNGIEKEGEKGELTSVLETLLTGGKAFEGGLLNALFGDDVDSPAIISVPLETALNLIDKRIAQLKRDAAEIIANDAALTDEDRATKKAEFDEEVSNFTIGGPKTPIDGIIGEDGVLQKLGSVLDTSAAGVSKAGDNLGDKAEEGATAMKDAGKAIESGISGGAGEMRLIISEAARQIRELQNTQPGGSGNPPGSAPSGKTGGGGDPFPERFGNSFLGGSVLKLARGGTFGAGGGGTIVNQPTTVDRALLGEAGRAEGVFPLDKTGSGKLGIQSQIIGSDGNFRNSVLPVARLANGTLGVRLSNDEEGVSERFGLGGIATGLLSGGGGARDASGTKLGQVAQSLFGGQSPSSGSASFGGRAPQRGGTSGGGSVAVEKNDNRKISIQVVSNDPGRFRKSIKSIEREVQRSFS